MKAKNISLAAIDALAVEGEAAETAVVFLHGYGANMHDLFPLWEMWHQEKFSWFFPNGVEALPMGYYEGRAWFPIDMAAIERAMMMGTHRDLSDSVPPQFDELLKRLELFLLEMNAKYKMLIVGGFSQGAMLASHLAMRTGLKIDGLVLLSGNALAMSKFPASAKSIPFYQSHGTRDPILGMEGAKKLEQKLQSLNFQGKLHVFDGGHEIPYKVINEVKSFLQQFA